jgi:hypothetical protein
MDRRRFLKGLLAGLAGLAGTAGLLHLGRAGNRARVEPSRRRARHYRKLAG